MVARLTSQQRLNRFIYFFPFQLVLVHLQRGFFLLIFWVILLAFITQSFATKFGVPYLFLAPEYRGEVGFWSFGILGFSLGAFIMAFNIHSYVCHANKFPFLGTLARPFFKFCINNSIIPLTFAAVYMYNSSKFLLQIELLSTGAVALNMGAFLLGNILFISLALLYFFPTNKNIFKLTGTTEADVDTLFKKPTTGLRRKDKFYFARSNKAKWRVDTYMTTFIKINLARDISHYDRDTLRRVFFQNHVNASFFEVMVIVVFLIIGAFQFSPVFVIPAASSTLLVFTVIIMLISITMSWLKMWTYPAILLFLLVINHVSGKFDILNMANYAYGLDYSAKPVAYNNHTIDSLSNNLLRVRQDADLHIMTLNLWLNNQRKTKGDPAYKPKMVIINTSGGGLRSTMWTMLSMQLCDSLTGGKFFENTRLISGSSGGTIGAAYYRELYLRKDTLKPGIYSQTYVENVSHDILNRVLFSFATNDIFIRFRKKNIAGYNYVLDRGMMFEEQLNQNTGFVLNKTVESYADDVSAAKIPLLVLAPSVVNDGRRLLIACQPISYLCYEYPELRQNLNLTIENIEFSRLFDAHNAKGLLLTSALRLNSTFPYVLPYATLPTEPKIEVMDAGLRDNNGTKITVQYLSVFRDWIEQNTSGVIIVQMRDTEKFFEPKGMNQTIADKLLNPIGSFYGNFFNDQDFNMDQLLKTLGENYNVPIHQIPLEIAYDPGDHIALSWHLSALEKQRIFKSAHHPTNIECLKRLNELMGE